LAFHGYGQNGRVFQELADSEMSVYAVNLPFHGVNQPFASHVDIERGLKKVEFQSWLSAFLNYIVVDKVHLIGYSMGARLVLCLCEDLQYQVVSVHLIAPDGFIRNPAYRLATGTKLGRMFFKRLPNYSKSIHYVANAMRNLGLMDSKVLKLVKDHTANDQRSIQLYKTWTYLRYLQPDLELLASQLAMESIELIVHLGRFDSIIPKHKVLKWSYLKERPKAIEIYELGHRLLVTEVFTTLRLREAPSIGSQ
jgi:pimeloyl-ACP methyl ester carboxylesterase